MTINTMDQLVAGLSAGQQIPIVKYGSAVSGTPGWASYWIINGQPGAAATPPTGSGAVPTNATSGAISFVNPSTGVAYLAGFRGQTGGTTCIILYDRLVHTSGLVGNINTLQTINSASVNRPDSTGIGAELFIEMYAASGSGATNVTISYTNQAGTTGQVATNGSQTIASLPIGQIVPMQLASGDTGIRSVQSITLSTALASAGNFGITIARKIAVLPSSVQNTASSVDPFGLGLATIPNNACLFPITFGGAQALFGMIQVAQG